MKSYSDGIGQNCLEAARTPCTGIAIRGSKNPTGPALPPHHRLARLPRPRLLTVELRDQLPHQPDAPQHALVG
ncbi:DUF397 domain-containing protein [Streptomyces lincolnensis]|uniref:DUF397 domain-containing protein n=1 Tax=Streptomyces lincolnensis TaxID=1915 RepID=UPI00287390A8|nr:DUF397 domain-containing protein [Streptomyces lincolnensis]